MKKGYMKLVCCQSFNVKKLQPHMPQTNIEAEK